MVVIFCIEDSVLLDLADVRINLDFVIFSAWQDFLFLSFGHFDENEVKVRLKAWVDAKKNVKL